MPKKILIIDDEPDVLRTLVFRLRAKGYEIFTAVNGAEAVQKSQEYQPDLILMDYHLPDLSAEDISLKIKAMDGRRDVPVILLTASIENLDQKAAACKAVDYLSKPVEGELLCAKVSQWIE